MEDNYNLVTPTKVKVQQRKSQWCWEKKLKNITIGVNVLLIEKNSSIFFSNPRVYDQLGHTKISSKNKQN